VYRREQSTHRIHIEHRRNLVQPRKLVSRRTKARLGRQVICDTSDVPLVPYRAELHRERADQLPNTSMQGQLREGRASGRDGVVPRRTSVNFMFMTIFSQGRTSVSTVRLNNA
jgi:hypothetical protein